MITSASFKRNYYWLVLVVFSGFLIFGFSENIKGPAIPRMQEDFALDEMQIGLLLAFNSLGYLLACTFTALLASRISLKLTCLLAFGSMAISGVFIYAAANYTTLAASYFFLYVGNGMLEIGLAILAARIFTRNTGFMMNLSHFFYGLSSIAAPIIASSLMGISLFDGPLGWRGMYLIMLSLSVIPIIPSLFANFSGDGEQPQERMAMRAFAKDPAAWLLVGALSLGVTSELAIGGWLVNFLEKAYEWDASASAGMLSAFFLCFTLARLILGAATDKLGFTLSLILFSGFSGICTVAAIVMGESGAFLFALAGAGIAPIYPTVMAFLAKRYPGNSDTAITFTVTLMGVATVVGHYLIGAITGWFKESYTRLYGEETGLLRGLQAGYLFIGMCALLCSVVCIILYAYLRKRKALL